MRNKILMIIALLLCVLITAFLILLPQGSGGNEETGDPGQKDAAVSGDAENEPAPLYGFALKYTEHLIETPEAYETKNGTRMFSFDRMAESILPVEQALEVGTVFYVDNYKNRNGMAPKLPGGKDAFGISRGASVPAYDELTEESAFRYLPDGTLVSVLWEDSEFAEVVPVGESGDSSYFVPQRYMASDDPLETLDKVVVIDRINQNMAAFERTKEPAAAPDSTDLALDLPKWQVVSYSLATTGKTGKYHQPTPLGYYFAVEKKPRFYYLKDGTNTIEGYAPYAVRFTAGAYIHGVPSAYRYAEDGSRVDPGFRESSDSLGTVPLSHKCVRTYTSHAKFLYDWYEHGKTIVIVIE